MRKKIRDILYPAHQTRAQIHQRALERDARLELERERRARLKIKAEAKEQHLREMAARVEAFRLQKKLATAKPVAGKCLQKACPFPPVLDGECRRHVNDRYAGSSFVPSQLAVAAEFSRYRLGYGR